MTNGMAARFLTAVAAAAAIFHLLAPSAFARSAGTPIALPVTVTSVGAKTLQVSGSDGRVLTLAVTAASLFLKRGLLVAPGEFSPGETALLRQRAGAGGRMQVVLLSDPDSAAVLERYRRRPLTGTILSGDAQTWVVQPADAPDGLPLTLRISARTTYRAGESPVPASAFGPGARVTVTTRGLADGLLQAVSVTDESEPAAVPAEPGRVRFVSGEVTAIQTDAGTVTVQDKKGASHIVATDAGTRLKVRRLPATLADMEVGMRVSAWLGTAQDADGNPIATTLSALDAAVSRKKGR